jgi:hypothetical protein
VDDRSIAGIEYQARWRAQPHNARLWFFLIRIRSSLLAQPARWKMRHGVGSSLVKNDF